MTNSYSQRGGIRIGTEYTTSWNHSWPLAHLTARETAIFLSVRGKGDYFFEKSNISAIRKYQGFFGTFSRGVQILHTKENYPQFVVFWCFWGPSRTKLISELQKFGYPIEDEEGKMWD